MALRIEAEVLVQLLETTAQQRHFLDRPAERLAGPEARVNADALDLSVLTDRDDDEVEWHAPMDGRLALRLGHQGHIAALLEVAHRAKRPALVRRRAGDAEDSKRVRRLTGRTFDLVTKEGHRAVGEPFEKCAPFRIIDRRRVLAHFRLELWPVAHGRADVCKDRL